jgi:hypothetical protein
VIELDLLNPKAPTPVRLVLKTSCKSLPCVPFRQEELDRLGVARLDKRV